MVLSLIMVLFLAACGKKETSEELIREHLNNASVAFSEKQYDVASEQIEKVLALQPDHELALQFKKDLNKTLEEADETVRTTLIKDMEKHYKDKRFDKLEHTLQKIEEAGISDPSIDDYKSKLSVIKKKQKDLDAYIQWLSGILEENNAVANDWRLASDSFAVQQIDKATFIKKVKEIIPKSNSLISNVESKTFSLNYDLSLFHTDYVNTINDNHVRLINVISLAHKKGIDSSEFKDESSALNNIKQYQSQYVQTLKKYADDNHLIFNFN